MKNLILVLCLFIGCLQAEAALPVTDQTLASAIAYGKSYQGEKIDTAMLQPWTINERFKSNPYRDDEHIVVYTPYLLTALDTAGKDAADASISIEGAKSRLKAFEGVLVIRAVVNAPKILKDDDLEVQLVQEGFFVAPYYNEYVDGKYIEKDAAKPASDADIQKSMNSNTDTGNADSDTKKIYRLQYNFYFDQAELDAEKPYLLVIKDKLCGSREFAVDPAVFD